jgi:hypothetical protein
MIEVVFPSYHQNEAWALHPIMGEMIELPATSEESIAGDLAS